MNGRTVRPIAATANYIQVYIKSMYMVSQCIIYIDIIYYIYMPMLMHE